MEHEDRVSEILQSRCGELTVGVLRDGRRLQIHNVASGRDMGATCDHITTNISPTPPEACPVDFFHTSEVLRLEDSSGGVLYERRGP